MLGSFDERNVYVLLFNLRQIIQIPSPSVASTYCAVEVTLVLKHSSILRPNTEVFIC